MRYRRSDAFRSDYERLTSQEKTLFRKAALDFSNAADRVVETGSFSWPSSLRVKPIKSAKGLFEMTWSFSGPDGRATWEWTTVVDEDGRTVPCIKWRRVGDHSIFKRP